MAISVELIAYSQLAPEKNIDNTAMVEQVNASAANLCYNAIGAKDILAGMTNANAQRLTRMMVKSGHHSTIEHVSFTFAIEGISRACTHQLVRHRIASYSQQSQRYVKATDFRESAIKPATIARNPEASVRFDELMDKVSACYKELVELGIPAEDARFVLPNAAETKIVVTMNARSLLHFFEERCCNRAQWEIHQVANMMLAECRRVAPTLFEMAGPTCEVGRFCREGSRSCGKLEALLKADAAKADK